MGETRTYEVVYANDWQAEVVALIAGDCMLPVSEGVYFHHRLQLLVVIKSELPEPVRMGLPRA